jgi:hypothetical protein
MIYLRGIFATLPASGGISPIDKSRKDSIFRLGRAFRPRACRELLVRETCRRALRVELRSKAHVESLGAEWPLGREARRGPTVT